MLASASIRENVATLGAVPPGRVETLRAYSPLPLARLFEVDRPLVHPVQDRAEGAGFSVVRKFVGHGIGRQMHEDPLRLIPEDLRDDFGVHIEGDLNPEARESAEEGEPV